MSDHGIDERLRAVERALGEGADPEDGIAAAASAAERLDRLEDRLDELEQRTDELDAGLQAVRGYVGSIKHVNDDVERRANAALAVAEQARTGAERPVADQREYE